MSIEAISAVGERPVNDVFSKAGMAKVSHSAQNQNKELSAEQQDEVKKLAERDREVKQHEQAHIAAAGQYAKGGAKFSYKVGPDGKQYATGGEVELNVAPVDNDPQATIQKARIIKKAALAPAEPSSQDFRVAAMADQMELQARQDLAQESIQPQLSRYSQSGKPVAQAEKPFVVDFSA